MAEDQYNPENLVRTTNTPVKKETLAPLNKSVKCHLSTIPFTTNILRGLFPGYEIGMKTIKSKSSHRCTI